MKVPPSGLPKQTLGPTRKVFLVWCARSTPGWLFDNRKRPSSAPDPTSSGRLTSFCSERQLDACAQPARDRVSGAGETPGAIAGKMVLTVAFRLSPHRNLHAQTLTKRLALAARRVASRWDWDIPENCEKGVDGGPGWTDNSQEG